MSNSALVSYTQLSPNCNAPRNQKISKITIHHMAGSLTLPQFGALVARPSRQMSANYAIDKDGNIGLFCDEANRSWCSSSPWNDHRAITIEVANDGGAPNWHVIDKSMAALLDLCTDICRRNGMAKLEYTGDKNGSLTMHCFYAATACPGPYLKSKFAEIAKTVTARLAGEQTSGGQTAQEQFVKIMVEKCQSRCQTAKLLPSLCIAQACLESAYGTSELPCRQTTCLASNRGPAGKALCTAKQRKNGTGASISPLRHRSASMTRWWPAWRTTLRS